MKSNIYLRAFVYLLSTYIWLAPLKAKAEDVDIYVGASTGSKANPKILIVLDNSANWSRASQKWPDGLVQGQSEVRAINTLVAGLGADVNMGLMEYATASGGNAGGFIRKAVTPMDSANKFAFSTSLNTIFNNINEPNEKVSSSFGYGDLMYSALNYFKGTSTVAPSSSVVSSLADSMGYTANYTTFKSPLSDSNACGRNFVIVIANNVNGAVDGDSTANGSALTALGGSISPQLQYQNYTASTSVASTVLGYTSACFSGLASCNTADYAAQCGSGGAYDSCTCTNNTTTSLSTCAAGTQRYSVSGVKFTGGTTSTTGPTVGTPTVSGTTGVSSCYASSGAASAAVTSGTDKGGLTCPTATSVTSGATTTTTTYSCSYSLVSTTPNVAASLSCPLGTPSTWSAVLPTTAGDTANTTACFGSNTNIKANPSPWSVGAAGAIPASIVSCPPSTTTVSGSTTTTKSYTCAYDAVIGTACGGGAGKNTAKVTRAITEQTTTASATSKYNVQMTVTPTVTTVTTTGSTSTNTLLGDTVLCYASGAAAATSAEYSAQCTSSTYNGGCISGTASAQANNCASGARYQVTGNVSTTTYTPTGTSYTPSDGAYADEWARYMQQPVAKNMASTTDTVKQSIITYTIDVFNAQQSPTRTALLQSMAKNGGGKYFAAKSEAEILDALKRIMAEIQSVDSTFASASLPVSATNRTQNANQVFIGMFRPDPDTLPRWFGNLKRYAIGRVNGVLDLVDSVGKSATNLQTGFIDDCAMSFWTTDSGSYWNNLGTPINPSPISNCFTLTPSQRYSDSPDGPTVEKGGAAQVLRKGNNPLGAATYTVNRIMLTGTTPSLTAFSTTSSGLSADLVDFTLGKDVNNDSGSGGSGTTTSRPSIHGDIVHARPLPINYGGTTGVIVYYGANDGAYRAVDANTGKERWSYVAPEHYAKLKRLKDNNFPISYASVTTLDIPSGPKDYFFDGSTGVFQTPTGDKVWIFPTQRRGGRMLYAFDVSTPTSNPTLKWRHGCPNLTDDIGCTSGGSSYSSIGQTWSTPNVAFVKGFSTTIPVLVVGGGYDSCEDADSVTKSCGSAKGRVIYVINADTGAILRSFTTTSSVAADVAMVDVDNDGFVDFGYALDTGGNVYRFDFVDGPGTLVPLAAGDWKFRRVAYTNGGYRKFLFQPSVFPTANSVYVAMVSGDRERPLIGNYPYTTPVVNRAYVYKDDLTASSGAIDMDGSTFINSTDSSTTTCTSTSLLADSAKRGWFFSLNENGPGEQGVTSALIAAGRVTFSTNRPVPTSAESCGNALGEARGYLVNLFNGSGAIAGTNGNSCGGRRSTVFPGGGLPPSPIIGVVPVDGIPTAVMIGAPDATGATTTTIGVTKVNPKISNVRTRTYKSINTDQ